MMTGDQRLKLILHVGAGKTGTTSIQHMLKDGREKLRQNGVWYLGLMLEYARQHYAWQRPTTVNQDFHALEPADAVEQVSAVLRGVAAEARAIGIHTLIWSNESFFDRNHQILTALGGLKDEFEVTVLAYVRRHDLWAQSAYVQWGLKHKTYRGNIKPFREWVEQGLPKFAERLNVFQKADVGRVELRNLDRVKDSVEDFKKVCGLSEIPLANVRTNESLGNTELLLRALFNDQYKQPVLPALFDRVVGNGAIRGDTPTAYLTELVASGVDLQQVTERTAEDREQINSMLEACGQGPLLTDPVTLPDRTIASDELCLVLARYVMAQAHKLENLERKVRQLTEQLEQDKK